MAPHINKKIKNRGIPHNRCLTHKPFTSIKKKIGKAKLEQMKYFEKIDFADVSPLPERDRLYLEPIKKSKKEPLYIKKEKEFHYLLEEYLEETKEWWIVYSKEFVEGISQSESTLIIKELFGKKYAIQGILDLHGCRLYEAKEKIKRFIKEAKSKGFCSLLIVHGRGLNSPTGKSVIKEHLVKWLNSGWLRKEVKAYCSARLFDGGLGATYILLK